MYVDTMCCKWTSLFWCQASGTRRRPPERGWTTILGRENDHLRVEMETGPLLSGNISFWIVASAGGGGGFHLSKIEERRSPKWRVILKYTINDAFTVIVLPGVLLLAALVVLLLCIYALVKRRRVEKYPTIRKTENDLSYRAGRDRQLPDCDFITDANSGCGQCSHFQENCYGNPVWKFSPNCLHAISQKNCLHWIRMDTKSNNRKIFYCSLDCTGQRC